MARRTATPEAEAPESTEGQTSDTTEAPATVEINLDDFKGAVTAALAEADKSTGQVPEEQVSKVNEQYRSLDGQKAKNAGRSFLEEQMLEAVGNLDAPLARSYNDLKGNLSAGSSGGGTKTPADPVAAQVSREASLTLAYQLVVGQRPETDRDLDAETAELVAKSGDDVTAMSAYLANEAEDKGDAPEVSPVVRAAFKAAQGKGTGGSGRGGSTGGPRKDIAKHIREAFAGEEAGKFLTFAEIAKFASSEYPEGTPPSQGAISARVFPSSGKCTVEGIEPVDKNEDDGKNPKGARKAA